MKKVKNGDALPFVKRFLDLKRNGLIRFSNGVVEVVSGNKHFILVEEQKFAPQMNIFLKVRKDVEDYLKNNRLPEIPQYQAVVKPQFFCSPEELLSTDLSNAYWNIAYKHGFISKKTYLLGISVDSIEMKRTRLASLSVLGRKKEFYVVKNGEITTETLSDSGNDSHRKVFDVIRHICFGYMQILMGKLGSDFHSYYIDCISYRHSEENRQLIESCIQKWGLNCKTYSRPNYLNKYK
jgi:hypothetical protein